MRLMIAIAAIFLAAPTIAQEPLTFKGLSIGANKESVLSALPHGNCAADRCSWHTSLCLRVHGADAVAACHDSMKYGGVKPLLTSATFRDDKLATVLVTIESDDFAGLAAAMLQRFGAPDRDDRDVVQNRAGATFDNRKLVWIRPDASLTIQKRGSRLDRGSVFLMGTEEARLFQIERARDAKAKAKAKDL